MSVATPTRWDAVRAEKRGDGHAGLPKCSRCKRPSVLIVCRDCHTCAFTKHVGYGEKGKDDGLRYPIRECETCHRIEVCQDSPISANQS